MTDKAKKEISIHPLLDKRRSPRAFQNREIEPEKLKRVFEAARWSFSCFNEQPWRYIYTLRTDKEDYKRMFNCLKAYNQRWVKFAPVLILAVAKNYFEKDKRPNRHAWHDVGAANAMMAIEAASLDIYLHLMEGFYNDMARDVLEIPQGYDPICMIAAGYVDKPEILPDDLQKKEKAEPNREMSESFISHAKFNQPSLT